MLQLPARAIQPPLVPIHVALDIIQHLDLPVQLVPDLDAQVPLPADALAQPVQLVVLLLDDVLMVRVDLLVVELGVVGAWLVVGGGRVVAVGEEGGAVGGVLIVIVRGVEEGAGARVVAESDRFGEVGGGAVGGALEGGGGGDAWPGGRFLGMGEVAGEGWVVGLGDGGGGRLRGKALELRGEVVVLGS